MSSAEIPDPLPDAETASTMSGLEFMRAMLAGEVAGSPMSAPMNFSLSAVEDGCVLFTGTPEIRHTNPMGSVHGGWYGTLLDSAMGCAVMTRVPRGSIYTTLEYKVNLIRALSVGTQVTATGTVDHCGRSTGTASGEIRGTTDGRLYATGSTTCLILAKR